MPSFDIVSEVDLHALSNAVDQANRVVDNRYDFKGAQAKFEREEHTVKLDAAADIQLEQMVDILRDGVVRCKLDPKAMDIGEASHSGQRCRRTVQFRHGLDSDTCKDIVKRIKASGLKLQAAIQDQQVRVTGKKRDDLQKAITLLKEASIPLPLQFTNMRD